MSEGNVFLKSHTIKRREGKMFSKTEIEFLKGSTQVSDNYERSLTHRILTKLNSFEEMLPLLENNPKTRAWLHGIVVKNSSAAEFSNTTQNQEKPKFSPVPQRGWCPGRDLDPGRELKRLTDGMNPKIP